MDFCVFRFSAFSSLSSQNFPPLSFLYLRHFLSPIFAEFTVRALAFLIIPHQPFLWRTCQKCQSKSFIFASCKKRALEKSFLYRKCSLSRSRDIFLFPPANKYFPVEIEYISRSCSFYNVFKGRGKRRKRNSFSFFLGQKESCVSWRREFCSNNRGGITL